MMKEAAEQELKDALAHLYDPDYQPAASLYALTGCAPEAGALAVQSAIIQAIREMKPPPETPPSTQMKQVYDLLHSRFVLKLTQEETAERLHMSVSSTRRAQRAAVHTLARVLWEQSLATADSDGGSTETSPAEDAAPIQAPDWRSQTKRELASLQASAPGTVSDVRETIEKALKLVQPLAAERGVHVEIGFIQPGLVARVHPSALRQILITAIGRLAQYTVAEQIALFAGLEDGNAKLTIATGIAEENRPSAEDLTSDILAPEDVSIDVTVEDTHVFLSIEAPSMGKITVLVVDDNEDMARFFRRATEGTRYHIVHMAQGKRLMEAIEASPPDAIVLDVMLPDVDGWEVLTRLHEDLATRDIPVIVCSVVREEALARSLGAACYLAKPVKRPAFIQALDQVVEPSSTD